MNLRGMHPGALTALALLSSAATAAAPAFIAPWAAALTQQALASGFEASVPPHVAALLGLTPTGSDGAAPVQVRQLVGRADQKVHTFNVTGGTPRHLVLFAVDEQTHETVVYLLDGTGKLSKALSFQGGGEPHEVPRPEARAGLNRERQFWSAHAGGGAAPAAAAPGSQPNPLTPH